MRSQSKPCSDLGLSSSRPRAPSTRLPRVFAASALPILGGPVRCSGSHGNGHGLVPGLPWTVRTNVRTASPATLFALQLYRPLSDTWDRKERTGTVCKRGCRTQGTPATSRAQSRISPKALVLPRKPRGDPTPWPFPRASRSRRTNGR